MSKVTGIGGLFFKSKDVAKLKDWYRDHLGFVVTEWGSSMVWTDPKTNAKVRTEWSPMKETTDYFAPGTLPYMINYLVQDLRGLIDTLRKHGVTVVGDVAEYDYGKFAHIMDPEGRKIELYEPSDAGFGDAPPEWNDKVVGLKEIYFKSDDPGKIKDWYKTHLGIDVSPMNNNDKLFADTAKPFVFSYYVRNLHELLDQLGEKSAWVIDPEGNKVGLWQA
jgi:predicted enzyme related to lactoylglutathione lyase